MNGDDSLLIIVIKDGLYWCSASLNLGVGTIAFSVRSSILANNTIDHNSNMKSNALIIWLF